MGRRGAALVLGSSFALVASAAGGYAVLRGDGYACADAVPSADVTETALPIHADADGAYDAVATAVEQELANARGRSAPLTENEVRLIEHGMGVLAGPPTGWTGPSSVLVDLDDPRLELVGDTVLDDSETLGETRTMGQAGRRAYVVVDAATGGLRWARDQRGQSAGGAPIGNNWVLVQAEAGRQPTVAALDPSNGHLLTCTKVGETSDLTGELSAWPVADSVAVAAGATEAGSSGLQLTLVDPGNGQVAWDQHIDGLTQVESLAAADPAVVLAATSGETEARAAAARDVAGRDPAGATVFAVLAVDIRSGSPSWTYQAEPDGGQAFVHSVVGISDDVVVVTADRMTDEVAGTGQVVGTRLVGLDLAEGQPRWTIDIANEANTSAADARVFGDVVVTTEVRPGDDGTRVVELVGRTVADGAEQWRIPFRGTALRDADVVGDVLLLPTNALADDGLGSISGHGMEMIDLRTGEVTRAFEGVNLSRVDVDDDIVAVTAYFGPVAPGALLLYQLGG